MPAWVRSLRFTRSACGRWFDEGAGEGIKSRVRTCGKGNALKAKPKGRKYRNLHARGGVIYYEKLVGGQRIRISAKTSSWEDAAAFRDIYEEHKRIGLGVVLRRDVPKLVEFATRYLEEDTKHLAPTTREERARYLKTAGSLLSRLGERRLDEVQPADLREWWTSEVVQTERSPKTGANHLDA